MLGTVYTQQTTSKQSEILNTTIFKIIDEQIQKQKSMTENHSLRNNIEPTSPINQSYSRNKNRTFLGFNHFLLQSQPEVHAYLDDARVRMRQNSLKVVDQALLNYKDKIDKSIKQQEDDLKKHEEELEWSKKLREIELKNKQEHKKWYAQVLKA